MEAEFKNRLKGLSNYGYIAAAICGSIAFIFFIFCLVCAEDLDYKSGRSSYGVLVAMAGLFTIMALVFLVLGIFMGRKIAIAKNGHPGYGKIIKTWIKTSKMRFSDSSTPNYEFFVLFSYTGDDGYVHTCRETLLQKHFDAIEEMGEFVPIYIHGRRAVVAVGQVDKYIEEVILKRISNNMRHL